MKCVKSLTFICVPKKMPMKIRLWTFNAEIYSETFVWCMPLFSSNKKPHASYLKYKSILQSPCTIIMRYFWTILLEAMLIQHWLNPISSVMLRKATKKKTKINDFHNIYRIFGNMPVFSHYCPFVNGIAKSDTLLVNLR